MGEWGGSVVARAQVCARAHPALAMLRGSGSRCLAAVSLCETAWLQPAQSASREQIATACTPRYTHFSLFPGPTLLTCLPAPALQILTDKQLCTARWGPLCIRFPSSQHLAQFAGCMRGVAVGPCCDTAAAASMCAASAPPTLPASHLEAGPETLPPPPPAWALRRAAATATSALQAQAKEEPQQQQESAANGADSCPCTPRGPYWALPSALCGAEPLHLATPPPLNRCALSGDGCAGAARVPVLLAPLPTPVPFFSLPTPVGQHPPDAVAAAIAMLEAGVTAAQAW